MFERVFAACFLVMATVPALAEDLDLINVTLVDGTGA